MLERLLDARLWGQRANVGLEPDPAISCPVSLSRSPPLMPPVPSKPRVCRVLVRTTVYIHGRPARDPSEGAVTAQRESGHGEDPSEGGGSSPPSGLHPGTPGPQASCPSTPRLRDPTSLMALDTPCTVTTATSESQPRFSPHVYTSIWVSKASGA